MKFLCCIFLTALSLQAHPMGNYSVSHYSHLTAKPGGVELRYVLDLAEIPTFQLLQDWDLTAGSPKPLLQQKAQAQMKVWARNLEIKSAGQVVTPRLESSSVTMAEGAGSMQVMRVEARFFVAAKPGAIEFEDRNFADRAGWKEVVVTAAPGATVKRASAGSTERSAVLTKYPQDPTVAPPQDLKASLEWSAPLVVDAPPVQVAPVVVVDEKKPEPRPAVPGEVSRGDYLSELLRKKELTIGMILIGIAVAFGLGAVHAFSPGHGKTMVAAYLVGSRGTARHAIFLGAMTTFTHTISVFALGFVTLFLSKYILPQTLYPVLGAISGLTIVWVGLTMLYRRTRKLRPHTHSHDHGHHHHHDHDHAHDHHHDHGHDHVHGPGGHTHVPEGDITMGSLIALGASGGLVPCPSGLVLLLSSIAIGRVGLGLILLVGFSAGLATVLTTIGLLVLYAKNLIPDREGLEQHAAFRYIPIASAAVIVVVGILMTGVSLGFINPSRFIG